MKTMKWIFIASLLFSASTLMAQTPTARTSSIINPVIQQISQLVSSLNLSNEQVVRIMAINQKYMYLEAEYMSNNQLTKKELKKVMKKLASTQDKEIKNILKENEKGATRVADSDAPVMAPSPSVALNSASQSLILNKDISIFNIQ